MRKTADCFHETGSTIEVWSLLVSSARDVSSAYGPDAQIISAWLLSSGFFFSFCFEFPRSLKHVFNVD